MKDTIVVNGSSIGPQTDVTDLLRRQLLGATAFAGRHDETPEQGVWNLFSAAGGTAVELRLVEAVYELLADPDVRVRAAAVGLAQAYAEKFDATKLLEILSINPKDFQGVESSSKSRPDLAWRLLRAIAGASHWNEEVVDRLRRAVLEVPDGITVLAGLVTRDGDWVVSHAAEVIGTDKDRAEIVLYGLRDATQRQVLAAAIPKESPTLRQVLRDAVAAEVKDPAERAKLLDILT